MLNLLLNIKFKLESITESKPKEKRSFISKIFLNGGKLIDSYVIYFYLLLKNKLGLITITPLKDDDSLPIISLTTFPARLRNLWMVLYCMYNQTKRPGKIVVTLANDEIVGGLDSLPKSLKYFSDKGVEFLFVNENLRSHNKYFFCRQKYSNRVIITIDDDLLYYSDTIERLMKLHALYPQAICSNRVHRIKFENNDLKKYIEWDHVFIPEGPSSHLIALGYSSVLYPVSFTHPDLYNKMNIKELSLGADDIWLFVMEVLSHSPVVTGEYYAHPVTLPSSQKIALQVTNNGSVSRNDRYLILLENEYNFIQNLKKNVL